MSGEEIIYNKDHIKLIKTPTDPVESEAIIRYFTKETYKASEVKKESPLGFWYIKKHSEDVEIKIKHYLIISKSARYDISYPEDKEYISGVDTDSTEGIRLLSTLTELIKLISARGITRVVELYKGTDYISPRELKREFYTRLFRINE